MIVTYLAYNTSFMLHPGRLLERVGTDWLRGELGGRHGLFPLAFVEMIEDLPPSTVQEGNVVTAVFDFDGHNGELSFKVLTYWHFTKGDFWWHPKTLQKLFSSLDSYVFFKLMLLFSILQY